MFGHSFLILLASAIVPVAFAAPTLVPIAQTDGAVRPNGYIVQYKQQSNTDWVKPHWQIIDQFGPQNASIRYEYSNGIAGTFSDAALQVLRSSKDVLSIERDTIGGVDALITQKDAPWGFSRISQLSGLPSGSDKGALTFSYTYDDAAGQGVDVYIVDTGINIAHVDFEGRAVWGKTFGGYTPDVDGFGHGTHVAGTAGGHRYGVAKKVKLIAVRVLDSSGSGPISDCIAGVQWATSQAQASGRPSVISMSLRYDPSDQLDAVVNAAVAAGIHVTVSAGNQGKLWNTQSPARASAPIKVGATDINDQMTSYSNYGSGVSILAPGDSIISAYIGSTTAAASISGTSMSAPHVAGTIALLISRTGNASPGDILTLMLAMAPDGIISSVPSGTVNKLLDNGAPYEGGGTIGPGPTITRTTVFALPTQVDRVTNKQTSTTTPRMTLSLHL